MDRSILSVAAFGAILFVPAITSAQVRFGAVQLPTFNFFTVNTTVEVPDSGAGFVGGVGSGASGCSEQGIPGLGSRLFFNVAGDRAGGGLSVSAEIHDFDAMDRQLLGADFDRHSSEEAAADAAIVRKLPIMLRPFVANRASQQSPLAVDAAGGSSLADIRRQQTAEDSAAQSDAQRLFDQAVELQTAGKLGVAKVFYQMAARRATGDLKRRAQAAIIELSTQQQSASAGRSSP
jgi:hypothetical protein